MILYNKTVINMQTGIIVTIGVIAINLIVFLLLPLGIKNLVKRFKP